MKKVKYIYKSFRIAKALSSCSESTGDIIATTERLKQELEITVQRQDIASCFLRDYQLSNDEVFLTILFKLSTFIYLCVMQISALRDEELSENFFKALSHVQEIHSNCKILLRTHHQVRIILFLLIGYYFFDAHVNKN